MCYLSVEYLCLLNYYSIKIEWCQIDRKNTKERAFDYIWKFKKWECHRNGLFGKCSTIPLPKHTMTNLKVVYFEN